MKAFNQISNSFKILFLLAIVLGAVIGCSSGGSSNTATRLYSGNYENKTDRISVLQDEVRLPSIIQDAEFELFNVNGFHNQQTLVPGASSFDYQFAVKIDTADIPKWTQDVQLTEFNEADSNWTKAITKLREDSWKIYSDPVCFVNHDRSVTLLIYKAEGILFKRVTAL